MIATTATAAVYAIYAQSRRSHRRRDKQPLADTDNDAAALQKALEQGTSLNAQERVCTVDENNVPTPHGHSRAEMRLQHLWHRATYCLILHEPRHYHQEQDNEQDSTTNHHHSSSSGSSGRDHPDQEVFVLVQRRSKLKDYCPGKLDPTPGGVVGFGESYDENLIRELQEEMGIDLQQQQDTDDTHQHNSYRRIFRFPYQDERVKVWGEFYEVTFTGSFKDLRLQVEEVEDVERMTLTELSKWMQQEPDAFMPDSLYAMQLYFQHIHDVRVQRKLLPGYSSSDLDAYQLRPKPLALFFDCDDTLYFDEWQTANILTAKIEEWCVQHHGLPPGRAYELYQTHGTALRGLLAEGYLESTPQDIDGFLQAVHDIPIPTLLSRDDDLRQMLLHLDPSIPKYIFTASVRDHAERCLQALGVDDLFVDIIDVQSCHLETKHSTHSFEMAMKIAGVEDAERCILLDDNLKNIGAARLRGWRSVLVGKLSRDSRQPISSEHAELEIDRIHDLPTVLPELFVVNADGDNHEKKAGEK